MRDGSRNFVVRPTGFVPYKRRDFSHAFTAALRPKNITMYYDDASIDLSHDSRGPTTVLNVKIVFIYDCPTRLFFFSRHKRPIFARC